MFTRVRSYLAVIMFILAGFKIFAQPVAGFNILAPSSNCNPAVYSFINTSTGAGLTYHWNFGVFPGINSIFENPSTTYLNCGSYVVKLLVTDSTGHTDSIEQTINIRCSPNARFTTSSAIGCVPVSIGFTSTSDPGSGTIANYIWDFGDGSSGSGPNPSHTYDVTGCKNVTLIVTNTYGCESDTTINNVLCIYTPPTGDFTASVQTVCSAPGIINYQASASGGTAPYSYNWLFPGGAPNFSSAANPVIEYSASGTYSATLVVTDAHGCSDTITKSNHISIPIDSANFVLNNGLYCAPATFNVSGTSPGNPLSWHWSVSPSATLSHATSQSTSVTLPDSGSYTICLSTTYTGGCTAQQCKSVTVQSSPVAHFGVSGTLNTCVLPDVITFIDSSSGSNLTYSWSFPSGTPATSTSQFPAPVNYSVCGNYSASLTVTDGAGCKSSVTKSNFLHLACNTASFAVSPSGGCLPLTSYFNSSASTGNPVAWYWDFGDPLSGNADTSTLQNPSHTYNTAGCYTVTLTTTNALGCVSVSQIESAVCCGFKPHANFSGNPPVNCANKPFFFTDSSTNTYAYTTYVWDFHDVPPYINESNQANPEYTYYDIGTYDITLIVSNYGCADTITKDNYVQTIVPIASPKAIKNCHNPLSVTLDGTASEGAQIYQWIILGGTPDSANTAIVTATYPGPGDYNVSLYVKNDSTGCDDLESIVVHITGTGAQFTGSPLHGCAPLQSCFSVTASGVISYNWQVTDSAGTFDTTASVSSPCFKFNNAGLYNVQLIVADTFGCMDTIYKPDYVSVSKLAVNFSGAPLKGCAPMLVAFTDSSTDIDAGIAKWSWNFGDNASGASDSSHLQNPTHTYHSSGLYSVNLTITDSNGCKTNTLKSNYIQVDKPLVTFTDTSTSSCQGVLTCFTTTTHNAPLSYYWSFGDGDTSSIANTCHLYTAADTFNISLVVTDSLGCTDTVGTTNLLNALITHPDFVASDTASTCPPLLVSFTNLSTGVDSTTKWQWQFGDGQISSLENPFHIYTTAGLFSVTLIISTSSGCKDTLTYIDYIDISGPSAYVSKPPVSGCVPDYTCMSVVSNSTNSYTWNLGDGTVLPGTDSICYTYIRTGTFYPELILNDGIGCIFSLPLGEVDVIGTVADFLVDTNVFCQQETVQFTDSSYGTAAAQSWSWNFGDVASGHNNFSTEQNPSHFFLSPGSYLVKENIVSTDGCVDSTNKIIIIHPSPLVSIISESTSCSSDSVRFTGVVTSPASINNVVWNFGDSVSGASNISNLQNPAHDYQVAGTYQINFSVTDSNGCTAQSNTAVTIHQTPKSLFSAFDTCITLQPIIFINNSQYADNYLWSFGDGSSASQPDPDHTYADTGVYQVRLITANSFCSDTFSIPVQIFSVPVAAFSLSATALCGPNANFDIVNHSTNATSYAWNFGDSIFSNLANPVAAYHSSGHYNILLVATNTGGCVDTAEQAITVYPTPNIEALGIEPAEGCQPLPVSFNVQASNAAVYTWNFGAGAGAVSSSSASINYTYADTGTYTVTLTATSINNCSDTLVLPDTIKIHVMPVAAFDTVINSSGYPYNGTVSFINRSKNANNYLWYFGDGTTSTDTNPTYEYARIDSYSVLLIASTQYGCVDTAVAQIYVIKKALYAPNALQPEFKGTENLVKVWKPVGIGLRSYRAQIFDKWGELMWESDSLSETEPVDAWDGTYLGKPCEEDVYVWKINAVFLDGTVWEGMNYKPDEGGGTKNIGSVTLIR